jgi:hypothetical protein
MERRARNYRARLDLDLWTDVLMGHRDGVSGRLAQVVPTTRKNPSATVCEAVALSERGRDDQPECDSVEDLLQIPAARALVVEDDRDQP